MGTANIFIWAMMAALLSAARWADLATWIGAPVSTTPSVVGGVMGAGIAAAGFTAAFLSFAHGANAVGPLAAIVRASASGNFTQAVSMPDRTTYAPEERRRHKWLRRSHFKTIIAAWIITVLSAAVLSAIIFFLISMGMG